MTTQQDIEAIREALERYCAMLGIRPEKSKSYNALAAIETQLTAPCKSAFDGPKGEDSDMTLIDWLVCDCGDDDQKTAWKSIEDRLRSAHQQAHATPSMTDDELRQLAVEVHDGVIDAGWSGDDGLLIVLAALKKVHGGVK